MVSELAIRSTNTGMVHRSRALASRAGPMLALVLACVVSGLLVTNASTGIAAVVLVAVALVLAVVSSVTGTTGVLMLLFGGVALIPVVAGAQGSTPSLASTHVPTPSIHGYDAESIRTAFIGLLVVIAMLRLHSKASVRLPVRVRQVAGGLVALTVLGLVVSAFTAHNSTDYFKSASQAAGQPLIYMLLLLTLVGLLQTEPKARRFIAIAWCLAVVAQGAIVAGQLATGAAYDAFRGLTRAQGTMGSDFLGVFAVVGAFGGAYLRLIAESRRERMLGVLAIGTGVFVLVASVSRGPLIGLALAVFSLMIAGRSSRGRGARVVAALGVTLVAGVALYAMQSLWQARLHASSTSSFDRPATWVSGARLAIDNSLTGVGPAHVAEVVASKPRYSETPYGYTLSNPHNSWLFVADSEGIPYALILVAASIAFMLALRSGARTSAGRYLVASLTAGGTVFFVNNLFNHPEIMLYMVLAASLLLTEKTHDVRDAVNK